MKRLGVVLLSVLTACAGMQLPRQGRPALPDVQFNIRDFRLANGMRILVEESKGSPLVGVFTTVGVGSAGDPVGKEGIAHLMEHLIFRAEQNRDGVRMSSWNALEAAGAGHSFNAYTWFDNTTYHEVASKDMVEQLITMEINRMSSPLAGVDEKILDVEREVVRNELRQRGENQIGPAFPLLQAAVFPPSHPYSRPIAGTHESLTAITLDDLKAFAAKYYRPSNMTMLVLGDVDLTTFDQVLAKTLPKNFWVLAPSRQFPTKVPATKAEPPPLPAAKFVKTVANVATPELTVVWSLPRAFGDEQVLLDFVTGRAQGALANAWSSDPDIVNVSVGLVPGLEGTMLLANATLQEGSHPEKSFEHIVDQLVDLWGGADLDLDQLRGAAVAYEERQFVFERAGVVVDATLEAENIAARGPRRVEGAHFTGDPLVYGRMMKGLAEVEAPAITKFAATYLTRDRARAVYVAPYPPDSKDATATTTGLAPVKGEELKVDYTVEKVRALGKSRIAAANETVVQGSKNTVDETLPNGLRVVIKRRPNTLPIAVVRLTMPVGSASSSTPAVASMLRFARPKLNRYGPPSSYGISWSTQAGSETTVMVGEGANGNVENMLAQLSEHVVSMHVEAKPVAQYQHDFLDYAERSEKLPLRSASMAFFELLYGKHPLGLSVRAADQRKVGSSDIQSWADRVFTPKGAVLVITGEIDPDKTMVAVKTWLSDWHGGDPVAPPPALKLTPHAPVVLVTSQPGATQATLMMGCLVDAPTPEKEYTAHAVASMLGGELFMKVRQQLGASYGISGSAAIHLLGVGRIAWSGSIENGRLGPALAVVKSSIDAFENDSLNAKNVGRGRWSVASDLSTSDMSSGQVAYNITQKVLRGESTKNDFERLAAVSDDEYKATWLQCKGNFVYSLVGDEVKVRAALKEAGLEAK